MRLEAIVLSVYLHLKRCRRESDGLRYREAVSLMSNLIQPHQRFLTIAGAAHVHWGPTSTRPKQ